MTANPLARARNAERATTGYGLRYDDLAIGESMKFSTDDRAYTLVKTHAGFADDMAEMFNQARRRDDIEWVATAGGLMPRTPAGYVAKRMNDDKRRFDEESRKANVRAEFPINSGYA